MYLASPSIQSHLTDSPEDEPLSTGTMFNNETNEQNQSVLSFPEHDTSPSQEVEEFINDDFNTAKVMANMFELVPVINGIKDKHVSENALSTGTLQLLKEKKVMVTVNKRIASEDTRVQDGDAIKLVAHDGMGGTGLAPTL